MFNSFGNSINFVLLCSSVSELFHHLGLHGLLLDHVIPCQPSSASQWLCTSQGCQLFLFSATLVALDTMWKEKKILAFFLLLRNTRGRLTWQREIPWFQRWFFQGGAYPLHSRWVEPCAFPNCGKLSCIICGSKGLHLCAPLSVYTYTHTHT